MHRGLLLILLFYLFCGCGNTSQHTVPESKYRATPAAQALLERFNAQEHRLEINDCELVYNGKPFFLGMTVEELSAVLDSPPDYNEGYANGWTELNLRVGRDPETDLIWSVIIYVSWPFDKGMPFNEDVLLLNSVPLEKDMLFGDFLEQSHYEFEDFSILFHTFELLPACPTKAHVIEVGSHPVYKTRGGGHLTMRGDFDPTRTGPVNTLNVYYKRK